LMSRRYPCRWAEDDRSETIARDISEHISSSSGVRHAFLGKPVSAVCVCVCHFFYDDKAMGNHITLSQLDAAAPESNYPLGDKPVSQPALSQTLVGHSVIVVRRVCICSLVSNFISRHL
jgi:hypothetical protein